MSATAKDSRCAAWKSVRSDSTSSPVENWGRRRGTSSSHTWSGYLASAKYSTDEESEPAAGPARKSSHLSVSRARTLLTTLKSNDAVDAG